MSKHELTIITKPEVDIIETSKSMRKFFKDNGIKHELRGIEKNKRMMYEFSGYERGNYLFYVLSELKLEQQQSICNELNENENILRYLLVLSTERKMN